MLADRRYMRGGSGRGPVSTCLAIMVILVAVFALQCIDDVYLRTTAQSWLALTVPGVRHGYVWQLLTFQFLHGGVLHILCNLIGLWYFGRFVENVVGRHRFLFVYFG